MNTCLQLMWAAITNSNLITNCKHSTELQSHTHPHIYSFESTHLYCEQASKYVWA